MDVRVYVDVKLGDGMDGGALLRGILQGLGATVYQRWSATARATHLVWKNGDGRTLEEARARGVAIVGLAWVNASQDAGGFVPAAPYALPLADRSRAREYLVRHDLATTSRKRKHTPKAFEAKPLRAADLPGLDDPRFRSVLKSDAESSSAAGSAAGSLSAFHRLAPWSAVSRAGTELVSSDAGDSRPGRGGDGSASRWSATQRDSLRESVGTEIYSCTGSAKRDSARRDTGFGSSCAGSARRDGASPGGAGAPEPAPEQRGGRAARRRRSPSRRPARPRRRTPTTARPRRPPRRRRRRRPPPKRRRPATPPRAPAAVRVARPLLGRRRRARGLGAPRARRAAPGPAAAPRERGRQPHRAPRARRLEAEPVAFRGKRDRSPRPPRPTTATTPARRRSGPGSGAASSSRRRRASVARRRRRARAAPHRPEPEIIVIDDTPVPEKVAVDAAPPPPEDVEPESRRRPTTPTPVAPMPADDAERVAPTPDDVDVAPTPPAEDVAPTRTGDVAPARTEDAAPEPKLIDLGAGFEARAPRARAPRRRRRRDGAEGAPVRREEGRDARGGRGGRGERAALRRWAPAAARAEPVVISASGVDEDVRGALREVSKRIVARGGPKARFADDDLLAKLRGVLPAKATHLVVAAKPPAARAPRTLKVLFALARGGCAIVTPAWAFASLDDETWAPPDAYLAGYGPPRPKKPNTLAGVEVHVVANALGPAEPPHSALQALVSAAGGRSVALRNCRVALVGESWTPYKAPAALRALHRNGHVLRVRWLFDAIEHQDPARPQATYRVPA
ncbi:hypothetical protein SO694_00009336 [Aureococcus anophagefferens]|uniref:BRCT domain-containing protein n=1 Tax=Aureococcus anophagefferens TaxID=44056 RepID=A0ABR1GE42_AURAN